MQQALFPDIKTTDSFNARLLEQAREHRALEEARYTKEYCIKRILDEEYLWDMRSWFKPKHEYTFEQVKRQILKWVKDNENGKGNFNCGHCVFCISRLLTNNWLSIDEIVELVMKNKKVKYADEIGSWFR